MSDFEISVFAALDVAALNRRGYRGFALLADPPTGQMVLFRSEPWGCECVGLTPMPPADEPHQLVELPALSIGANVTPADAFAAAEAELNRMNARGLH